MEKYPPLLLKYLKQYQEDPTSRIFAPLAECYRKIGLVDEAIELCKEGLSVHPDFSSGKVALARAYFDKKMYQNVRNVLLSVIDRIPDNVVAQRLLAESSLKLGFLKEAQSAFKMLLYFQPDDIETFKIVQELEGAQALRGGSVSSPANLNKIRKLMKLQNLLNKVHRAQGLIIS